MIEPNISATMFNCWDAILMVIWSVHFSPDMSQTVFTRIQFLSHQTIVSCFRMKQALWADYEQRLDETSHDLASEEGFSKESENTVQHNGVSS